MTTLRSVLWIGAAKGVESERIAETPLLDLAWVRDVDEALALPLGAFDAVVLDGQDAEATVAGARRLASASEHPPLLVRVPGSDPPLRRELLAAGAADVVSDAPEDELHGRLSALCGAGREPKAGARHGRDGIAGAPPIGMVGRSAAMRRVFALVERARRSRATVLLTGATGTGKELVARAIHAGSERGEHAFVAVNCAAFPDTLLESELFGHVRGAFTGADRDKAGLFELADGGTLFLDEVGETSGPLQAKLLRALQEREVRPVGGGTNRPVDARVIAATNRDLRFEVANGHFREDLYYRLAVFPISVPPLCDRPEDILPLAEHFLALHGEREGRPGCRFSREAAHLLLSHSWPGNVRELENEVQRILALAEPGEPIDPGLLSERVARALDPVRAVARQGETLRQTLDRIEAWLIRQALERRGGRRAETARILGVTREGLYKKMKRLGIE